MPPFNTEEDKNEDEEEEEEEEEEEVEEEENDDDDDAPTDPDKLRNDDCDCTAVFTSNTPTEQSADPVTRDELSLLKATEWTESV